MHNQREKSTNVMGITVSVLLHAIFFAGCLALDASNLSSPQGDEQITQELPQSQAAADDGKIKS